VTPDVGIAEETFFQIYCDNFISSTTSPNTFRYQITFVRGQYENKTNFLLHEATPVNTLITQLSLGDPSHNYSASIQVQIQDPQGPSSKFVVPVHIFPSVDEMNQFIDSNDNNNNDHDNDTTTRAKSHTSFSAFQTQIDGAFLRSDFSTILEVIALSADDLNHHDSTELEGTERPQLVSQLEQVLTLVEQSMPAALETVTFLTFYIDAFRQITDDPYSFSYNLSLACVELLERLTPYYQGAIDQFNDETLDPTRDIQVSFEQQDLHQSLTDLIGDLIIASNNNDVIEGRALVDRLFAVINSISSNVWKSVVYASDGPTFWGNRMAKYYQYSPREKLILPLALNAPDKPVNVSWTPGVQFSSDVLNQLPTSVYLVLTWYLENPFPWADDSVASSVTGFEIMDQNFQKISLHNVTRIRVFVPNALTLGPPTSQYEARCQWFKENDPDGGWSGDGCKISSPGVCTCTQGSIFSFGYYLPDGVLPEDHTSSQSWWASPGMWIAMVVAIICAALAVCCMYLLPWRLLKMLRKVEREDAY